MKEVITFKIPNGTKLTKPKLSYRDTRACTTQFIKASLHQSKIVVHPVIQNSRTAVFSGNTVPCDEFVIGNYKLVQLLGEGSTGVVYLAENLHQNSFKRVAIKILKPEVYQNNENAVMRFFKEVKTVQKFNHPNIIKLFDFGETGHDKLPWMAMEYFEGRNLREIIKYHPHEFNLSQKVNIITNVAKALVEAHKENVIHRDIKPENILVNAKGEVKLTDFGIVQTPESTETNIMKILGTPYYLSPEAFTCPKVKKQSDIYSLGSVAYELFLNKRAFQAESLLALGFKVQGKNPVKPTKIQKNFPLSLQRILEKMLKKKSARRYQNATKVVEDLENALKLGFTRKNLFKFSTWNTLS